MHGSSGAERQWECGVFGPELRRWIVSLDPEGTVALMRLLLVAEAGRLNLPAGTVNMPGNIYAPDGGIDGHSALGPDAHAPFPGSETCWQVKATATFNVSEELGKADVVGDIAGGRDYILVCSRELVGLARERYERDISTGVTAISRERRGGLIGVEDLERLARLHPTVPGLMDGPAPLGLPLERWAVSLEPERFPFVSSPGLEAQVELIRAFVNDPVARVHLHVFGDSGVGKSRTVFEALRPDGIRERVAANLNYGPGIPSALVRAAEAESNGIVVVDEVSPAQQEELRRAAATAGGRIRLISIGDRHSRSVQADSSTVEILPLPSGIVQTLVAQVAGITPEDAGYVARLSEGYPRLAVLLAMAVRDGRRGHVIDLIRGRQVDELLSEMIRDPDTQRDLAHLALVYRLGFDEELELELEQFCAAFGIPPLRFRGSVERETGRLVAKAGRYRRVSPQALAVWLAHGLIGSAPDRIVEALGRLPDPLFESFRQQLTELGGDQTFDRVLTEVMARRAASFRNPSTLRAADAQFLNALSFASPELAAGYVRSLFEDATESDLRALGADQRRALVWGLEHLLWFESTYEVAAEALLALAVAETETWSNNATGVLSGSFQMNLGGTEVSLSRRLEWLDMHAWDYGEASALVAVKCAAQALEWHQMRSGGWRGGRLQPIEWSPSSSDEVRELQRRAMRQLVEWAHASDRVRGSVSTVLARCVWLVARNGDWSFFAESVEAVDWTAPERATLIAALRRELEFHEDLDAEGRGILHDLAEHLATRGSAGRLETTLASEVWDLGRLGSAQGPPAILVELADELSARGNERIVTALGAATAATSSTTFELFRLIGERHAELIALASDSRLRDEARVGFVAGLGRTEAASAAAVIRDWSGDPESAHLVPWAAATQVATSDLVGVAVQSVNAGQAPLSELNRFRYGHWAADLSGDSIGSIVRTYLAGNPSPYDLDAAVGMLETWLESHPDGLAVVDDVGRELIARAARVDQVAGLAFGRNQLADRLRLGPRDRLPSTLVALEGSSSPDQADVEAIRAMAADDPDYTVSEVVAFVLAVSPFRLLLENSHLLSVVEGPAGSDRVASELMRRTLPERRSALRHLDFTGPTLDPVVETLLAQDRNRELWAEASTRFIYPGEVVMGPYSRRLSERLDQLNAIAGSDAPEVVRAWAEGTASSVGELIHAEVRREEEWEP